MSIYRAFISSDLYKRLEKYRPTEAQMPEEYQVGHRSTRDDWALLKGTTRIDGARRVPLPFKIIEGNKGTEYMLFDPSYPLSPGHKIEMIDTPTQRGIMSLPHVLTDRGGYGAVKYAAWIDNEWRHVFTKYTRKTWFGKRLSAYWGLHQDNHVSPPNATTAMRSDLMCWIEPPTASWVTEV